MASFTPVAGIASIGAVVAACAGGFVLRADTIVAAECVALDLLRGRSNMINWCHAEDTQGQGCRCWLQKGHDGLHSFQRPECFHRETRRLAPEINGSCVNVDLVCATCGALLSTESMTRDYWDRQQKKCHELPTLFPEG